MTSAQAIIVALLVAFVLMSIGFYFGGWAQRSRCKSHDSFDASDWDRKFARLSSVHQLVLMQLDHCGSTSSKRLGEIHRLQAEVRALKFEREARESDAESGG